MFQKLTESYRFLRELVKLFRYSFINTLATLSASYYKREIGNIVDCRKHMAIWNTEIQEYLDSDFLLEKILIFFRIELLKST